MNDHEIVGSNTSPYSRKLRAILRYRRFPHIWRAQHPDTLSPEIASWPRLMPMFRMAGSARFEIDTTPLAYLLEARYAEVRSIIPPTPQDGFLCHLIEDFADEWCTKIMFYYRWANLETARFAATWVISDLFPHLTVEEREQAERGFFDRQRGRMTLVGCAEANGVLIEEHFLEILEITKMLAETGRYLFGTRPSLADFSLYGQLSQLVVDPWPQRLVRQHAAIVESWVGLLDDASGVDGQWEPESDISRSSRERLLRIIGRSYLPFLLANNKAIEAGSDTVSLTIDGAVFSQPCFKYQTKCYREILSRWNGLGDECRESLRPSLSSCGCLPYLENIHQSTHDYQSDESRPVAANRMSL